MLFEARLTEGRVGVISSREEVPPIEASLFCRSTLLPLGIQGLRGIESTGMRPETSPGESSNLLRYSRPMTGTPGVRSRLR